MALHAVLSAVLVNLALAVPPGAAPPPAPPPAAPEPSAPSPTREGALEADPDAEPTTRRRARTTIARDFGNLYDLESFRRIGGALVVGGLLANTSADQEVQDGYREDVRSPSTDDFAEAVEILGDDWVGPAFVVLGVAGELVAREPAGQGVGGWVRRTGRSALVGLPAVYYLQQMTGGNRPADGLGSEWEPFDGSHGVSGHTFLGAVPFLTVARMSRSRVVDVLAVAASTLAGWGRFNDDQHYLSQVLLGWYLAWEATGAVAASERGALPGTGREEEGPAVRFVPAVLPEGGAVWMTLRF
jgi:hypothetical protein